MDATLIIAAQAILSAAIAAGTAWAFLARLDQRVKHIEENLMEGNIRERLSACETLLKERGPVVRRKSPISLTERGVNLLVRSGSQKFVNENFSELLGKIELRAPRTAYDVQEYSRQVIGELSEDERIDPVKEYLFRDGSTLEEAKLVMGVYLRDKVLKHKNWNVEDIDDLDYAPSQSALEAVQA